MTPNNPYRTALLVIGVIAIVLGLLLWLLTLTSLGAPVVGVGTAALLLWLVVSAIGWVPAPASKPESEPGERADETLLERVRREIGEG